MKITEQNSKYTRSPISFNSRLKLLNVINPISYYHNRYMKKSANLSRTKIQNIIPELDGIIKHVNIKTGKNIKISAWDINPKKSETYVLFLHGMAQNISEYQKLYKCIIDKNMGVFAVEYRGYGANRIAPLSEDKLRVDVSNAYQYLTNTKKINPKNIIIMGHSMGGSLASDFARKHPEAKSLILIAPIYNLASVGKKFMTNTTMGESIPKSIINMTSYIKPLEWLCHLRFSTANKIGKIKIPTYILQSENDAVTTVENARKLAKKAKSKNILKGFSIFEHGGHKVDMKKIKKIGEYLDDINKISP